MDGRRRKGISSTVSTTFLQSIAVIVGLVILCLASLPCCAEALAVSTETDSVKQTSLMLGPEPTDVTLSYLRRTVEALQKAIDFFAKHYSKVNLDAVIGTRIVQGTTAVLLENLQLRRQTMLLPDDVVMGIQQLQQSSKAFSDEAEPRVAINQPLYYNRIGPTIRDGLWNLNYTTRTLSRDVPQWRYVPVPEATTEKQSDDCIMEFYDTSRKTGESCVISDECWSRMTRFGYSRYSLSHEIFYLQLGEMNGCLREMTWKIVTMEQPGFHVLQDTFCANMLRESEMFAREGYLAPNQDIFMEHGALCGMYGYWQFFHYDWLDSLLSWQDPRDGCYRWAGWPEQRIGGHHVTKREEQELDDGCLCHRTTVAASALTQYIRYLVEAYITKTAQTQV